MADSFVKDPQAVLDYTWDWTAWCAGVRTIIDAEVTVPDGLTKVGGADFTDTIVTQVIAGGTLGQRYMLTCRITTAGGIIDERSLWITIRDR